MHQVELSVGDVVRIGDFAVTVIEIDGEDISFRIDGNEQYPAEDLLIGTSEEVAWSNDADE